MTRPHQIHLLLIAAVIIAGLTWFAFGANERVERSGDQAETNRLVVVWTSGDPDVAHRMVLMYTNGAQRQGWFDEVRLIVWGPSQRLLVGDKDIQAEIAEMQDAGVHVQACIVCADSYGIADDLSALDLEVKPMGAPLSEYVKSDWHVLTF